LIEGLIKAGMPNE